MDQIDALILILGEAAGRVIGVIVRAAVRAVMEVSQGGLRIVSSPENSTF